MWWELVLKAFALMTAAVVLYLTLCILPSWLLRVIREPSVFFMGNILLCLLPVPPILLVCWRLFLLHRWACITMCGIGWWLCCLYWSEVRGRSLLVFGYDMDTLAFTMLLFGTALLNVTVVVGWQRWLSGF